MIHYRCSQCGSMLKSPSSMAGQEDRCPDCGHVCILPTASKRNLSFAAIIAVISVVVGVGGGLAIWVCIRPARPISPAVQTGNPVESAQPENKPPVVASPSSVPAASGMQGGKRDKSVVIRVTETQMDVLRSLPEDIVCITSEADPITTLEALQDDQFACWVTSPDIPRRLMAAFGRKDTVVGLNMMGTGHKDADFRTNSRLRLFITHKPYADGLLARGGVSVQFEQTNDKPPLRSSRAKSALPRPSAGTFSKSRGYNNPGHPPSARPPYLQPSEASVAARSSAMQASTQGSTRSPLKRKQWGDIPGLPPNARQFLKANLGAAIAEMEGHFMAEGKGVGLDKTVTVQISDELEVEGVPAGLIKAAIDEWADYWHVKNPGERWPEYWYDCGDKRAGAAPKSGFEDVTSQDSKLYKQYPELNYTGLGSAMESFWLARAGISVRVGERKPVSMRALVDRFDPDGAVTLENADAVAEELVWTRQLGLGEGLYKSIPQHRAVVLAHLLQSIGYKVQAPMVAMSDDLLREMRNARDKFRASWDQAFARVPAEPPRSLAETAKTGILVTNGGARFEGKVTEDGDTYILITANGGKMRFPKTMVREVIWSDVLPVPVPLDAE